MVSKNINVDIKFPERSKNTTDRLFTWEEVRQFLDKETTRRTEYITKLLENFRERYGEEVLDIAAEVIYNIGYEKGALRRKLVSEENKENDLESLANIISHTTAQLFLGNKTEVKNDTMTVTEDYCPHPKKWKEMGLPLDRIVKYCSIFDQVDRGMIEGYNDSFETKLTGCVHLAENGVCQMFVRKKSE